MSKILVFGHQNPDSDAIGSSVALPTLQRSLRFGYGSCCPWNSNEETAFVLNYFGVEAPRVITSAKAEGQSKLS